MRLEGTEIRIFLLYDLSLKAEQTAITPKPRTNFPESPSQLSFTGSGPLCLKSSLESSSDYHIGLGLVLALASGSVKRAPSSHIVGKPHSVAQRGTELSVYKVSSVLVQLDFSRCRNFCTLIPAFQIFPISLDKACSCRPRSNACMARVLALASLVVAILQYRLHLQRLRDLKKDGHAVSMTTPQQG